MAVSGLAKELQREGRPVIALSAGEPDFPTPEQIVDAGVRALSDGHTKYTQVAGIPELREAICRKLKRDNGVVYGPNEIVCCNGAKQAVAQAVLAVCSPGDEVVIPAPYWVSYPAMALLAGAEPVIIETGPESGYRISAEQLSSALTPRSRVLILCSPSNPTGSVYTRGELEAIAEVVSSYPDLVVVSDEIYEYILFDAEHVCFASLPGMRDKTVTINGFSKAYAMTGWRLGYLAAPEWIAKAAAKVQGQTTSAPSTISQHAGLAALEMNRESIQFMVDAFRDRRDFMLAALQRIEGVVCPKPEGAFYLFPDVSSYFGSVTPQGRTIVDSEDLCMYMLREWNVAMVPGGAFGSPSGLRISYANSMEELDEAVSRLSDGLAALTSGS
jgi:aspartate/methionine/tyrosine aminotransferase